MKSALIVSRILRTLRRTVITLLFLIVAIVIDASALGSSAHPVAVPVSEVSEVVLPVANPQTREEAIVTLAHIYRESSTATRSSQGMFAAWIPEFFLDVADEFWNFIVMPRPNLSINVIVMLLFVMLPHATFTIFWMVYAWNDPRQMARSGSPQKYLEPQYSFTALVPARHEEAVIKDTIYAVNAIDYPAHLKEILVLVRDEDDDETIAKVKEAIAELGDSRIQLITFREGPRNKPNGLNRGLRLARNQVVCIFDAEDEPHPEIYSIVNTVMLRDSADVVQSGVQLMNIDSTWFSALNCLEYLFWFRSGLSFFTRMLHVTPLGGNTVFFKRDLLQRIAGWDDQLLTEDADIGMRMTLEGAKFQIVYDGRHVTQEETPANVEQFIKQRTRWAQGFYEIFFKFDWWKLPKLRQRVGAIYILMSPFFHAITMLYLPVGLYLAFVQSVPVGLAILSYIPLAIFLLQMLVNIAGIQEFAATYQRTLPRFFVMKLVLVYFPFQLMLAFSSLRAIYRFLQGQRVWEKTTHSNVHRIPQAIPNRVN